jgi:hypothetical protein
VDTPLKPYLSKPLCFLLYAVGASEAESNLKRAATRKPHVVLGPSFPQRETPLQLLQPPPDPAKELMKEYPELEAFGVDWDRKWLGLRERLVEIAKVLRRFPWMVEVVRQRPMGILHPYMVEVYVTRDNSEACLSLNPPKAFCARDGAIRETKLELEFKRYEVCEEKIREVYRPKGLLAYTTAAGEYVRIL